MEERASQDAAEMHKVVGHPGRIKIALCLEAGELSVGAIAEAPALGRSVTSQYLRTMRVRGLLSTRLESASVFHAINWPELYRIVDCIRESGGRAAVKGDAEA